LDGTDLHHSIQKTMEKQFISRGTFKSNFPSGAWNTLWAVPLPAARLSAATKALGSKKLRCVCFALLSVLSLAPLSQAQNNRPSGTVVTWGHVVYPYVEPGARFTAISAGIIHTVALKSDGSVVAWGDNGCDQTDVPSRRRAGWSRLQREVVTPWP
jgi:hypothetical protein